MGTIKGLSEPTYKISDIDSLFQVEVHVEKGISDESPSAAVIPRLDITNVNGRSRPVGTGEIKTVEEMVSLANYLTEAESYDMIPPYKHSMPKSKKLARVFRNRRGGYTLKMKDVVFDENFDTYSLTCQFDENGVFDSLESDALFPIEDVGLNNRYHRAWTNKGGEIVIKDAWAEVWEEESGFVRHNLLGCES